MLLYQKGMLNLDAPVTEIIKDFPEKQWPFTTRQLLSHTAGLPDYEDLNPHGLLYSLLNFKEFSSVQQSLEVFKDVPLLFEPGTDFKYNSFGPVLASRIVEVLSGISFEEYMKEHIFTPLQMKNTSFDKGSENPTTTARFYEIDNLGNYRNWHTFGFPKQTQNLSYKWAGGGILSTPTDLVLFGTHLLNNDSLIQKTVKDIFFTPQKLRNGSINPQRYALGWRVYDDYTSPLFKKSTPLRIIHHAGVSKGSMNFLCMFPDEKIVINLSTNGRSDRIQFSPFWDFTMKIASVFL
jgi:CubicO group peptidase (beta-lactamase class C family)